MTDMNPICPSPIFFLLFCFQGVLCGALIPRQENIQVIAYNEVLFFGHNRLLDIIHEENKLFLVFEFLDLDLKKYMDTVPTTTVTGLPLDQVKVHIPHIDHRMPSKNPMTTTMLLALGWLIDLTDPHLLTPQ